jgi:hypothetical protein
MTDAVQGAEAPRSTGWLLVAMAVVLIAVGVVVAYSGSTLWLALVLVCGGGFNAAAGLVIARRR